MNLFSKGTVLAGAVAALFACGGGSSADQTSTPAATEPPAAADPAAADPAAAAGDHAPASAEQIKCTGINDCKGTAECAAADGSSSCKGQNSCKGKGWISASAEDCSAKGGSVIK